MIVCPVRFDSSPKWNQAHLAVRPTEGIIQLDAADKAVRLHTTAASNWKIGRAHV